MATMVARNDDVAQSVNSELATFRTAPVTP